MSSCSQVAQCLNSVSTSTMEIIHRIPLLACLHAYCFPFLDSNEQSMRASEDWGCLVLETQELCDVSSCGGVCKHLMVASSISACCLSSCLFASALGFPAFPFPLRPFPPLCRATSNIGLGHESECCFDISCGNWHQSEMSEAFSLAEQH